MSAIPAEWPMYIDLTIVIPSENCTDKKHNKSLLLRKLEEAVTIFNIILPILSLLFNIYLLLVSSGSETDVLTLYSI